VVLAHLLAQDMLQAMAVTQYSQALLLLVVVLVVV
jgi:hypothetical protein